MNNRSTIMLFILTTVFFTVASNTTAPAMEVTVKGYGTIYGKDKAAARDRGLEDAQRKAVEQAMGTMISSESITQNYQLIDDRILSLSSGYIKKYRIVSESASDGELVIVIAAEVGMEKLSDSLQAIKSMIRRMDKPKIMVLIAEQSIRHEGQTDADKDAGSVVLSATNLGIAENALIEYFRAKGFDFVDRQALAGRIEVADPLTLVNDKERIRKIANLTDAQVVIFGHAQSRTGGKVSGIYSGQANISLRALKTDTGEIIAASTDHAAVPFVDPSTANTKALSEAATRISRTLMDQILRQWQRESSGTRNVALTLTGVSYAEVRKFRVWLPKYVRGIKSVHQRSVRGNTAELDIDIQGSAENLADELSEKKFNDKTIQVLELLPNKVNIELK